MNDTLHVADGGEPAAIRVPFNVFPNVTAKTPSKSARVTVAEIAAAIQKPRQVQSKKQAPLVTLVSYHEGANSRGIADIESVHAVYGDIDEGFDPHAFEAGWAELERLGAQAIAHQTYSHTPEAPRWRVIVFLDEPISPEHYRDCWEGLNDIFGGMLDENAKDCARLNYWPSCPPGETRETRTINIAEAA